MEHFKLREVFKPSMADLGLYFYQLERMIEVCPCCCHGDVTLMDVHYTGIITTIACTFSSSGE